MKSLCLFWLALLAISFGCKPQPNIDEALVTREVLAIVKAGEAGWNAGNIEEYMQQYWQSDRLRFASGGNISMGWQPVFERYSAAYPDKAAMGRLTFDNLDITVISADAAIAFGKWQLDREQDSPWGLFTLLLRKKPEGWRIVHDHTSSGGAN